MQVINTNMNNLEIILKAFDEKFTKVRHDGYREMVNTHTPDVKSFLSSHLTELLQSLIVELEGEKKELIKHQEGCLNRLNKRKRCNCGATLREEINQALNLAQERIRDKLKE